MKLLHLDRPEPDLVRRYILRFENEPGYSITDRALIKLFDLFPLNRNLDEVLLKVSSLNSLYNTNIYAVFEVARHIVDLDIDQRLVAGSTDLVDEIANVNISGKKRRNYSFATKYCSWHAPDDYPIYDTFVEQLIWAYQKQDSFADFNRIDLKDYSSFKELVKEFRRYYSLVAFSFKELDKFLWLYGRQIYSASKG